MERIARRARESIDAKVFPGCVIGIVKNGGRMALPFGRHTYSPDSSLVSTESIYDGASLTKSVVTATLALQLIDEGALSLDDPITAYLPNFRDPRPRIRHLFTHTLGNTIPLSSLADKTPDDIIAAVCAEELREPGTIFNYSNTPSFLLGLVLENLRGPVDAQAEERIFNPLSMTSATFHPNDGRPASVIVPSGEGIQGIVHDESARVFSRAHRAVGHAGLFSNITDLLAFCDHLLTHPDPRLSTNQIPHLNASTALGWELDQEWMGERRTPRTFGKTGFTGTSIVCDFDRETAIIILSNRTYPHRPENRHAIDSFRAAVCDIVFSYE